MRCGGCVVAAWIPSLAVNVGGTVDAAAAVIFVAAVVVAVVLSPTAAGVATAVFLLSATAQMRRKVVSQTQTVCCGRMVTEGQLS